MRTGHVSEALEELERANAQLGRVVDPFARTSFLYVLSFSYMVAARYEEAVTVSARAIEEGERAGIEFAVDHSLLIQAAAYVGLRKLRQAQVCIAELERRSQATSDFVRDNLLLVRVRLAITVGDLDRALALLDIPFAPDGRSAFHGESQAYRALALASRGKRAQALRCARFSG